MFQDAQRLEDKLTRSAALANSASLKVKELDTIRERVREASKRVDDAMEGSRCISGVTLALAKNDLEGAASFIGKYRALNLEPSKQLEEATVTVKASLVSQLVSAETAALNASDPLSVSEVARLASLLSAVGGERQARIRYADWVRRRTENTARARRLLVEKDVEISSGQSAQLKIIANGLSDLFESAAGELTKRLPEATESLSSIMGVSVIYAIMDGAGLEAANLIQMYRKICDLSNLKSQNSNAGKTTLTKAEESRLAYLDSVALICSRIFLWRRFCEEKLQKQTKHHESFNQESSGGQRALDTQVSEIVAEYVGLEERFLLSSVQKAIQMNDLNSNSNSDSDLNSDLQNESNTMVDYVFFVLQKGAHRAISTLSSDGASAVLNILIACLDSFLSVLEQMLSSAATKAYLPELSGQVPYATALNSLSISAEFVSRLKGELESSIKRHFAHNLQGMSKVETIFEELNEMAAQFRKAVVTNLQSVAETLAPSLRDVADEMSDSDYLIDEKQYSARQVEEGWPRIVRKQTETLAIPFKKALLPACYEILSRSIVSSLAARLERQVLAKKFNALGALQLSRDISAVTHGLTALCPSARSDVARLSQMAVTLCVESPSDVHDLAAGPQWRLTPGETRRLLARRVEFAQQEIDAVAI